jgi:hypothetical protein
MHVPGDGLAEPKHVVYLHNRRVNDIMCKKRIYIYCGVSVFFMTGITSCVLPHRLAANTRNAFVKNSKS